MNKKNKFKNAVVQDVMTTFNIKHPKAVRDVETSFKFYPEQVIEEYEHCGDPDCSCGNVLVEKTSCEAYSCKVETDL